MTREKQFWDSSRFRDWNKRVSTCPHLQVYIVLIIRQVDKQKGKLKLGQACPQASAFQNRLSTPAGSSYTLLFFLFINLSEMSIQKMTSWNYLNDKKFWMSIYTKILESVFVKHYAPNICLPLIMAKFAQCRTSTKIIGLCRKIKQVMYSSSSFQTASSNLADKVEMPFAKVQNSRKIWQHLF